MTDPLPATQPDGSLLLDWRTHKLLPRRKPCRSCYGLTILTDDQGRPCHKTCAEAELETQRRRDRRHHGTQDT